MGLCSADVGCGGFEPQEHLWTTTVYLMVFIEVLGILFLIVK